MNPNSTPTAINTATAMPPQPTPIMDVVAPRNDPAAADAIDDATAAAATIDAATVDAPTVQTNNPAPASAPQVKVPRPAGNGVGLAILATVIIVLVLAVLATFAYMHTK